MDARSGVFYLGLPLGTWFRTSVRLSLFFPLLIVVFIHDLGPAVGSAVTLVLFVSILIHEFAHVMTARATGGDGDEILIWPLGGLAYTRPAPGFTSEFWIPAAGPLSNLVQGLLCAAWLFVLRREVPAEAFDLWVLPAVSLSEHILSDILLLGLSLNFKLFIINLLPAPPLDGASMLLAVTKLRWEPPTARRGCMLLAQIVCVLVALVGLLRDDTFPVFLAFLLMAYCLHEVFQLQLRELMGLHELGFEGGEAAEDREAVPSQPGLFARWRQQRAEQRRVKELRERQHAEQQLDLLLDKVHREGMQALSEAERRFLTQASTRYRRQEH